ncbi:DUF3408 domain-containing protein [Hoylesella timonensis]|uniref:Conjugative transposon protein TraC n=1 Tax=Hoylesella timonensis CRIS 5C-B1 TaxID=679189 RepID=D1W0E0_9BACT|nr:DUF3408 domain-containing protein [Hoylesella timonensis]EFA97176.1 hypothetical protein HMPREF9019_1036 [Hoylesella timonensis CRIS 5C-B1]
MKSLKEQREKLLQAKLEEMADIGVKKRTEENTPDFDDPIDLDDDSDSVEEDASASLSKTEEQEEIPEETSFNVTNAKTAQLSKRKRNGRTKESSPAMDFPEYEQRFLTGVRNGRNKSGFSIHTEILQILRDVLSDIRSEASITGYIENILLDHLKTYQDLLNHTASQRRRDKTIDL